MPPIPPITLDKILTVSARDYVDSENKGLANYDMVGVHSHLDDIEHFAKRAPEGTEVIVDYRLVAVSHPLQHSPNILGQHSGTALIPKLKTPKSNSDDADNSP